MKDLDFDRIVELHPALHQRLLSTLARDSKFLETQGVMDYSLLLGITHQAPLVSRDVQTSDGGWPAASGQEVYYMGIIDYLVKFTAFKLLESTFKSFKYARVRTLSCFVVSFAVRTTHHRSIFSTRSVPCPPTSTRNGSSPSCAVYSRSARYSLVHNNFCE
jgi:hypothetical protein